ncbi:GGDEF domain-containing protein [Rhodoferax antarcticus]|uniref:GGDEF domain-containing protein n=1 Tax=Rhodoferax antarcticus TaxID=81479 RepID=UPI00222482A2|nr:GGDEF domain-containing protein [Rhodoferax antarcticus]MCW2311974.1 hemerythrin [Rhodoferax antarcticus]
MEAFRWDHWYVTGLPAVDEQHHYLVDIINQFGQSLMQAQGANPEEIERLFQELARYTQYHFSEEEALMVQSDMDARHLAHHTREHAQFLQDVVQMRGELLVNDRRSATALLSYLTNWLAYHILGTDQMMARLMKARAEGISADEAYESSQQNKDPATAILLQAMSHLVEQISDRNRALLEMNQTLEARVAERTQALLQMNQRLETIAMTDVLTGLPNRRHAMQVLETEWQLAKTSGDTMACMMIDADGFKKVNDTYGHDAGDEVLRQLARCLTQAVRNDDVVCRLGGDEFLIICTDTPLQGALQTAEKVRREVAELQVPAGDGFWHASISVGVAASLPAFENVERLLKTADDGVYAAKANGRNCVASVQA